MHTNACKHVYIIKTNIVQYQKYYSTNKLQREIAIDLFNNVQWNLILLVSMTLRLGCLGLTVMANSPMNSIGIYTTYDPRDASTYWALP